MPRASTPGFVRGGAQPRGNGIAEGTGEEVHAMFWIPVFAMFCFFVMVHDQPSPDAYEP